MKYLQEFKTFLNNTKLIKESLIFDEEIVTYNLDKFIKNRSTIFITGISGSGKTTIGKKIADKFNLPILHEDNFERIIDPKTNKPSPCESSYNVIKNKNKFVYEGIRLGVIFDYCGKIVNRIKELDSAIIILGTSSLKSGYRAETRKKKFSIFRFLSRIFDNNPITLNDMNNVRKNINKDENYKTFKTIKELEEYMGITTQLKEEYKTFQDNIKLKNDTIKYKIENKKGSIKIFYDEDDPEGKEYPLKKMKYPVDYGYIKNKYIAEDEAELDIFVGTGDLYGYMVVYRLDVPRETKMIYKVSNEEWNSIIKAFKPVVVEQKKFKNEDEFKKFILKFRV